MEEWKIISQFPQYSISNFGRIKRIVNSTKYKSGTILHPFCDKDGYLRITLREKENTYWFSIHRLVGEYFLQHQDIKELEINHKDGNKKNNHISNLEWVTRIENYRHSIKFLNRTPIHFYTKKIDENEVLEILKLRKEGFKSSHLSQRFGITKGQINRICNGKRWKHITQSAYGQT